MKIVAFEFVYFAFNKKTLRVSSTFLLFDSGYSTLGHSCSYGKIEIHNNEKLN